MTALRLYDINYKGLKPGLHDFDYVIDGAFFKEFAESEVLNCDVKVNLNLDMNTNFFVLNFDFKGKVIVECDRCLDDMDVNLETQESIYVYLKENDGTDLEEDADVVFFPPSEDVFNLAQLIYEFIHLNLPFQRVHEDDENGDSTCNEEVTKYIGGNSEEITDPRWSKLKDLKG